MTFSYSKVLILIVHLSLGSTAFSALCSNNSSFKFTYEYSSKSEDCLWLKNQDDSIREPLCRDSTIRSNCSFSCGLCCNDNPFARFVINGNSRTCSWIVMKDRRKNRFCDQSYGGHFVKDQCPLTCNNCPSFISLSEPTSTTLTTAPIITTSSPNVSTRAPTAAPTKSYIVSPTTNLPTNAPTTVNIQHENGNNETFLTEQTEEKVFSTEQNFIKENDERTKKSREGLFLSIGLPLGICGVLLIVALYVKRKSVNQTNNTVKSTQKREENDTKVESGSFGFFKSIDMWTHSEDLDSVNFDESRSMEYEDYLDNNSIVYQNDVIEGITTNPSMDSLEYSDDE